MNNEQIVRMLIAKSKGLCSAVGPALEDFLNDFRDLPTSEQVMTIAKVRPFMEACDGWDVANKIRGLPNDELEFGASVFLASVPQLLSQMLDIVERGVTDNN